MGIDAIIRSLAFAESRNSGEAMMMIAKHRAELHQALAAARAPGDPSPETQQEDVLSAELRAYRALDRKA